MRHDIDLFTPTPTCLQAALGSSSKNLRNIPSLIVQDKQHLFIIFCIGKIPGKYFTVESIRRGNFAKYPFLGVWSPGKSYLFLQNFENALLEKLICSYGISFSWKILCVLTKFLTRSPGKFDLFLWYFFFLEIRMCSCRILNFLPFLENAMCSCTIFGSPGKKVCSYKRIMSSPGKFICVLITSKPPGKFDVFQNCLLYTSPSPRDS